MVVCIILAVVAGLGFLALLFKPFFGDVGGFVECLKYWFTPDIISLFRGEWGEDWWSTMKLQVWLVAGILMGVAVYFGTAQLFGVS